MPLSAAHLQLVGSASWVDPCVEKTKQGGNKIKPLSIVWGGEQKVLCVCDWLLPFFSLSLSVEVPWHRACSLFSFGVLGVCFFFLRTFENDGGTRSFPFPLVGGVRYTWVPLREFSFSFLSFVPFLTGADSLFLSSLPRGVLTE
jgi:hypothetical protein